jgi:hypothetical protein
MPPGRSPPAAHGGFRERLPEWRTVAEHDSKISSIGSWLRLACIDEYRHFRRAAKTAGSGCDSLISHRWIFYGSADKHTR